jgi:hypothetical protein
MKPSFLHWLLCIGLVTALLGISLLQAGAARAASVAPSGDQRFQCVPNEHTLCIEYRDFGRLRHRFSCQVKPDEVRMVEGSFGYPLDGETIREELDRRLIKKIQEQAGPLAPYVEVGIEPHTAAPRSEAPVSWNYKHPVSFKPGLPGALRAKALEAERRIKANIGTTKQAVYDDYYKEKGFWKGPVVDGQGRAVYEITYKRLAGLARPLLEDCFNTFLRQAGPGDDEEVMILLSALFQEMPFELPKNENDFYRGDFRTPIAVLRRGQGDCDSKSVALSSLWRSPGPQMILLLSDLTEEEKASVPPELRASQHAFLGYQSSPGKDTVRAGVLHYTLYEASHALDPNAEKLIPGKILVSSRPRRGICLTDDCCGLDQANCRVEEDARGEL